THERRRTQLIEVDARGHRVTRIVRAVPCDHVLLSAGEDAVGDDLDLPARHVEHPNLDLLGLRDSEGDASGSTHRVFRTEVHEVHELLASTRARIVTHT